MSPIFHLFSGVLCASMQICSLYSLQVISQLLLVSLSLSILYLFWGYFAAAAELRGTAVS